MHRGTLLAVVVIGLLVVVIAAWTAMSPVSFDAYAVALRNDRTGQVVTCDVRGQRQDDPGLAFDLCRMACMDRGFAQVGESPRGTIIDFRTPADRRRAMQSVARFIPAACRDGDG